MKRKKELVFGVILISISLVISLATFEMVARLFVAKSTESYGTLFGIELPPIHVVQGYGVSENTNQLWTARGKNNPLQLSIGDLHGVLREDNSLSFTFRESAMSKNGWWRSNALGARAATDDAFRPPTGKKRILIFGESYAQGSRVRQEETWLEEFNRIDGKAEAVNFAVDGYGMGQSFLRYQALSPQLEWQATAFVLVPETDLWRDMNVSHFLGERWYAYTLLPRFKIENDKLKLITPPYAKGSDIYLHDTPNLTDRVREHLRRYDPFYFRLLYEETPVVGHLILFKLMASIIGEHERAALLEQARSSLNSEGLDISRHIFKSVDGNARQAGRKFFLLLLPDPDILRAVRAGDVLRQQIWKDRANLYQSDGVEVVDLLPEMLKLSDACIDSGYDGTHYGPQANRQLGRILHEVLEHRPNLL